MITISTPVSEIANPILFLLAKVSADYEHFTCANIVKRGLRSSSCNSKKSLATSFGLQVFSPWHYSRKLSLKVSLLKYFLLSYSEKLPGTRCFESQVARTLSVPPGSEEESKMPESSTSVISVVLSHWNWILMLSDCVQSMISFPQIVLEKPIFPNEVKAYKPIWLLIWP